MSQLIVGTAVLAAYLAGMVALLAPCCAPVMIPAFLATSFRRRVALTSMTVTFAAGLAAVILPIAVGAAAISRLVTAEHGLVFGLGGGLMVVLGAATLAGWRLPMLPGLAMRGRTEARPLSVFLLGAFSGAASACCAPVLAGVVGLSAATATFGDALILGTAYVFGMVTPLFVLALLWDRFELGGSRLLGGFGVTLRFGRRTRRIPLGSLLGGALLVAMGGIVLAIAAAGPDMGGGGLLGALSAWLQHVTHVAVVTVGRGPAWIATFLIAVALGLVLWKAADQAARHRGAAEDDALAAAGPEVPVEPPSHRPVGSAHREAEV